jgi:hypothetical protein
MMTAKVTRHLTPKQRIYLVMEYYRKNGANSELANKVYRSIINKSKFAIVLLFALSSCSILKNKEKTKTDTEVNNDAKTDTKTEY